MERRDFFRAMIGGVAAAAAVRAWPFRVYSFPSDISEPRLITLSYAWDTIPKHLIAKPDAIINGVRGTRVFRRPNADEFMFDETTCTFTFREPKFGEPVSIHSLYVALLED